jgi:hypothetical protein
LVDTSVLCAAVSITAETFLPFNFIGSRILMFCSGVIVLGLTLFIDVLFKYISFGDVSGFAISSFIKSFLTGMVSSELTPFSVKNDLVETISCR